MRVEYIEAGLFVQLIVTFHMRVKELSAEEMSSSTVYMANPPAGTSRFEGDTLQPNMAACGITTALIAVGVVGLRLYTRIHLTEARFQIDDSKSTSFTFKREENNE